MKKLLVILLVTGLAVSLTSGCGSKGEDGEQKKPTPDKSVVNGEGFAVSLSVEPPVLEQGGQFRLTLNVSNESGKSRTFDIASGQTYDFFATDSAGDKVWVWSEGMSFIQVVQQLTIEAGGSKQYIEFWKPEGVKPGKYTIQGLFVGLPTLDPEVDVEIP